jgi:hypothetical protein
VREANMKIFLSYSFANTDKEKTLTCTVEQNPL